MVKLLGFKSKEAFWSTNLLVLHKKVNSVGREVEVTYIIFLLFNLVLKF